MRNIFFCGLIYCENEFFFDSYNEIDCGNTDCSLENDSGIFEEEREEDLDEI